MTAVAFLNFGTSIFRGGFASRDQTQFVRIFRIVEHDKSIIITAAPEWTTSATSLLMMIDYDGPGSLGIGGRPNNCK